MHAHQLLGPSLLLLVFQNLMTELESLPVMDICVKRPVSLQQYPVAIIVFVAKGNVPTKSYLDLLCCHLLVATRDVLSG